MQPERSPMAPGVRPTNVFRKHMLPSPYEATTVSIHTTHQNGLFLRRHRRRLKDELDHLTTTLNLPKSDLPPP
ncbi:hypothetical protein L1887_17063 [Cichorium endivia]|nr:hypothetical protein L1887_17063 [Cichorium endivia]